MDAFLDVIQIPSEEYVFIFQLLQLLANGEEGDMRLAGEVISQPSTDEQREQQGLIDVEDR